MLIEALSSRGDLGNNKMITGISDIFLVEKAKLKPDAALCIQGIWFVLIQTFFFEIAS